MMESSLLSYVPSDKFMDQNLQCTHSSDIYILFINAT
jgi:hypothetical protein